MNKLEQYLYETEYDADETEFLVKGFREGFDIGYEGPVDRKDTSENIPLKVGSKLELWQKMMKEVKMKRYAGPFTRPPFKNFIQSPVGLVPKAGNQTRLIFHLSYNFHRKSEKKGNFKYQEKGTNKIEKPPDNSVNACTPEEKCSVHYNDLDYAIRTSFKWAELPLCNSSANSNKTCTYSKTDVKSAFRLVPLSRKSWKFLLMAVDHPVTGKKFWFADKCLPFGASISCSHFQRFSCAVKHIFEKKTRREMSVTNYLDDFLFVAATKQACNAMVSEFLNICNDLGIPISEDKTELATDRIVFLGIILDGSTMSLSIPEEKRLKALNTLQILSCKRKATVLELQSLAGFLNFLNKAIHPGRAFTRRMYAKFSGIMDTKIIGLKPKKERKKQFLLKPHHHVTLDQEFKEDCKVWMKFLDKSYMEVVARPMIDVNRDRSAIDLNYYSDASGAKDKGFGVVFKKFWTFSAWEENYIENFNPSIEYLELYALCIGIFTWGEMLRNSRFWIFCDNESVEGMVNNITSGSKNCMKLIRMLTLKCLDLNLRIFVKHVSSKNNYLADNLSRIKIDQFWSKVKEDELEMNLVPDPLPEELWPASKIWIE